MQERTITVTNRMTMPHKEVARVVLDGEDCQILAAFKARFPSCEIVETIRIVHQPA